MRRLKTKHIRTFSVVVLIVVTLFTAFHIFRGRIYLKFQNAEENYLTESAKAISEVFYIKLDDQLVMLESQARYFQSIDLSDYNAMKSTIMSTKGIGEFKNIGVANASGATINYNGTSSGNILLSDYYQEAMQGNNAISESTVMDEDGDEVLVLAVPIKKDDTVKGVIYGTFTEETLNSILDSITFSDTSSNLLFNDEGKILAQEETNIEISAEYIGDVIPDAETPKDGDSQSLYFTEGGQNYIAVLVPIGIHDWYFANIMPESVVTDQTTQITSYVGVLIAVVIILFLIVLLHILSLIHSNDQIAASNERIRRANAQSNNIIFSYDYRTEKAVVDGSVMRILPKNKPIYAHSESKAFLDLIHPEDSHIKQEILAVPKTDQLTIQGEARILNADSQYYWYRLNMTVIRDENGKPLQLFGSAFDVDKQRNKEMQLIEQATTDSLTGILNKGAFQKKTEELLGGDCNAFALFIIDLDNFKAVNDNLGHATGDQVLTDIADKLSEIFGSRECVGRIGGDEFAAVLSAPKLTAELVEERAECICRSAEKNYASYAKEVHVSVSIGAVLYPEGGSDYDALYRNADQALYRVKKSGKNMYALYRKENHDA